MKLYAIDTKDYSEFKFKEMWVPVNAKLKVNYPNSLYLTFVSESTKAGNFEVGYSYTDTDSPNI
jgi:hypothetical protein